MKAKCEGGIHHELCHVINNRLKVKVKYQEDKKFRTVEPHDYGILEGESNRKLLVYQLEGESRSGDLPDWRELVVTDIRQVIALSEQFSGTRPARTHHRWSRVFASVWDAG
jgi:hypothetical protein